MYPYSFLIYKQKCKYLKFLDKTIFNTLISFDFTIGVNFLGIAISM